jgi:CBS domain-containing protein
MGKKVRDLIGDKKTEIYYVTEDDSLTHAVGKMIENHVSCMLVKKGENFAGIVTERDVTRCFTKCSDIYAAKVSDAMSSRIRFVEPEDTLEFAAQVMRTKGIRHLPVFDGDNIIYVLSIRDLAFAEVDELQGEVKILKGYIFS